MSSLAPIIVNEALRAIALREFQHAMDTGCMAIG